MTSAKHSVNYMNIQVTFYCLIKDIYKVPCGNVQVCYFNGNRIIFTDDNE